jgi:hypothetical protein
MASSMKGTTPRSSVAPRARSMAVDGDQGLWPWLSKRSKYVRGYVVGAIGVGLLTRFAAPVCGSAWRNPNVDAAIREASAWILISAGIGVLVWLRIRMIPAPKPPSLTLADTRGCAGLVPTSERKWQESRWFRINGQGIYLTAALIGWLGRCQEIEMLDLSGAELPGELHGSLESLTNVQQLWLPLGSLSEAELRELRVMLPNCDVRLGSPDRPQGQAGETSNHGST